MSSSVSPLRARRRGALLGQSALCGALSFAAFGLIPGQANADPNGTTVVHGGVTIHKQGKRTEFRQTTGTAILTHESFNIRSDESVHFDQPTTRSLAVNRVIGKDLPTDISGKLTATGNVWVINPSGIAISKGAEVNVNGLIATSADISNDKILSGDRTFSGAPDGSKITNDGIIRGGDGSVVLVAPKVENTGTITTNGSDVALGAGSGFTVDMDGDGLTRFEVTPGSGVKITANGEIKADGGAVYMSAESKDTVRDAIVSVGGKVEATRIENKGGEIVISANKGKAEVTGKLDVKQGRGRGGKIIVTGDTVVIGRTASLDATGETDGGTVHVGGAYKGDALTSPVVRSHNAPADAPLPTARISIVERGADIKVNAGANGNGGEAVIWADNTTAFYGNIEAKGGFLSGDGGLVEVSGKINLAFDGKVDTSSPFGDAGSLLLDPAIVEIVAGAGADDTELTADQVIDAADGGGGTFVISLGAVQTALAAGGVTIAATDTVDLQTGLDLSGVAGTNTLTLTAGGEIDIDQTVTLGDNPLVVESTGERVLVTASITSTGANVTLTAREIDISGSGAINVTGGTITLAKSGTGDVLIGGSESGGGGNEYNFSITNGELGDLTAGAVVIDSNGQAIEVDGQDVGAFTTFRLESDGGAVNVNNLDTTGTLQVAASAGVVTFDGNGTSTIGTLTIESAASVGQSRRIAVTGATSITSAGAVTLDDGNNDFTGAVSVSASGQAVSISDANTFTMGTINVNTLAVSAVDVNVDAGATVAAPGGVTLTNSAGDGVVLGFADNADVTVFDLIDADLAILDGAPLTVVSSGAGTGDIFLEAFAFTNNLTINSSEEVQLQDTINFGANTFTISAGDTLTQFDATTITAGAVDWTSTGAAIVQAGGGASTAAIIAPDGTFSASGNITLLGANNFAPTTFNASGVDISVNDISGIGLGSISATGNLLVTAGGTITDTAGSQIIVGGTTSLLAESGGDFFDIQLDNSDTVGGDLHDLGNDGGDTVSATGEDILIRTTDDIVMGVIAPNDDSGATVDTTINNGNNGDLTLAVVNGALDFDATVTLPGDLQLEAGGAITDSAAIAVTGTTSLSATGSITLDDVTNTFGTDISASGDGIALVGASSMNLGAIASTGTLLVSAGDDITDLAGGATDTVGQISVSGTTSLTAVDDILIDQGQNLHIFGDTVTASADAIILHAGAGLTVDDITASNTTNVLNDIGTNVGNLTLTGDVAIGATSDIRLFAPTGGTITQTGGSIIADLLRIDSAGGAAVTLNQAANDVNTLENTTAVPSSISFTDTDDLNLGTITAGALTLNTGGVVTDSATVSVTGATSITTTGDAVTLDVATNNFGGPVSVDTTNSGGDAAAAVEIVDGTAGISLAAIDASTLEVTSTGGAITDTSGSSISVTGTTSLIATGFNIALDNTTGEHDFGGVVAASGADITLRDLNSIILGDVDATGNLTVTAAGGSIADDDAGNVALGDVNVAGVTSLSATTTITLDDLGTDFDVGGSGDDVNAAGTDIALRDANSIVLGDIDAGGNLSVTAAAGSITDDGVGNAADADVDVTGTTSLSATNAGATANIILDDTGNDFGGAVSASSSSLVSTISLVDLNAITLGTISSPALFSTLSVTAGGTISDTVAISGFALGSTFTTESADGSAAIELDFGHAFTGAVTLDTDGSNDGNHGNATLVETDAAISLGAVDVNNLTVTGMGTISQTAAHDVEGTATFNAEGAITLTNVANDFSGSVNLDSDRDDSGAKSAVSIVDANALQLGAVDALSLTVTTGGALTDTDGSSIVVSGATTLTATGFDIMLDNNTVTGGEHDFDSDITGDALTFSGANVTIRDVDQLSIGASTATASLTLTAMDFDIDGLVTVGGGTGTATFLSSRFQLGTNIIATAAADADLNAFVINFSNADAANVSAGTTVFRQDASVTAPADGAVTTAAVPIVIVGFTSGGGVGNVVIETTVAGADISIGDDSFGGFNSTFSGDLTLISADDVVDDGLFDNTLSVVGATSISADVVTLDQTSNDFGGVITISANTATISDTNSIVLGDIDVTGNLTVTALGGSITDDGPTAVDGDINVDGVTSLSASADIVLDDTFNDFNNGGVGTDPVNAAAVNITLNDNNNIILGDIDATGNMTVVALGTITDDGDGAAAGTDINVDGTTSLSAGGVITLDDVFNDFDAVVTGDTISANGTDVVIFDSGALTLGDIVATNSLTVRAGGSITQAGGTTVSVSGDAAFTSDSFTTPGEFSDIFLDNVGNTITGAFSATGEDISIRESGVGPLEIGTVVANTDTSADATLDFTGFGIGLGNFRLLTDGATDGTAGSITTASTLILGGETATSDFIIDNEDVNTVARLVAIGPRNLTLNNNSALILGAALGGGVVAATGDVSISAEGSITQDNAVSASNVTLTGVDDAGTGFFDILLANTLNSFSGELTATGQDISVTNSNAAGFTIGNVVTNAGTDTTINNGNDGDLTLISTGGAIVDVGGDSIVAPGTTSLSATSGGADVDIVLDNDDHNFGINIDATGASITFTDLNDIVLGDIDASGTLSVTARAGNITDNGDGAAAGADVNVAGVTSLSASGDIVLDDTYNDFDDDAVGDPTDEVDATATNLTLTDADGIALGDISVTGNATITAGTQLAGSNIVDDGAIAAGDGINIDGNTSLSASGGVTLDDVVNDFGRVDASVLTSMTLYDDNAIVLGAVSVPGSLTVTAEGDITDVAGSSISVAGTTSLLATDGGAGFSDIVLDNGLHDFGTDSAAADTTLGDATTEVDATGANITLSDVDAIKLGAVTANGALTVAAGGSVTDTDGDAISVSGDTSISAVDTAGTNFFDVRLDGVDADANDRPHDFNNVDIASEGFSIVDINSLTLRNVDANSDGVADPTLGDGGTVSVDATGSVIVTMLNAAGDFNINSDASLTLTNVIAGGDVTTRAVGRTRIGNVESTGGAIDMYTDDYFSIILGDATPLTADGNLFLAAPLGGFITDGAVMAPGAAQTPLNAIPEGLTFTSATGLLEFDFNVGFQVVDTPGNGGVVLTLDAPVSVIRINEGLFAIGTGDFLDEVRTAVFNPFEVAAVPGDPDLLMVTGELGLMSDVVLEVRLQNTSPTLGSQNGSGTVVTSFTHLGGAFSGLSLFGSFNGSTSANAALNGFRFIGNIPDLNNRFARPDPYPAFVQDPANTANGCVIGAISSCTPLGSVTPFLDFDDGRLLSIKFVDPTEDEDDPFSNRGDEEEWE